MLRSIWRNRIRHFSNSTPLHLPERLHAPCLQLFLRTSGGWRSGRDRLSTSLHAGREGAADIFRFQCPNQGRPSQQVWMKEMRILQAMACNVSERNGLNFIDLAVWNLSGQMLRLWYDATIAARSSLQPVCRKSGIIMRRRILPFSSPAPPLYHNPFMQHLSFPL